MVDSLRKKDALAYLDRICGEASGDCAPQVLRVIPEAEQERERNEQDAGNRDEGP